MEARIQLEAQHFSVQKRSHRQRAVLLGPVEGTGGREASLTPLISQEGLERFISPRQKCKMIDDDESHTYEPLGTAVTSYRTSLVSRFPMSCLK